MAQYIDKDAVVAEIERRIKEVSQIEKASYEIGLFDAYKIVLSFINTLEVKEVNLEKEIAKYLGDDWVQDTPKEVQLDMIGYARHFFELGLKAGKEEVK